MRIRSGTLERYRLAFRVPLVTSRARLTHRRGLIVRLTDESDRVGLGDAAPLPGFSAESLEEVESALRHVLAAETLLVGFRLRELQDIGDLLSSLALPTSAAHALDQALLELLAGQQGLPIWRLLAGAEHQRHAVPLHALVSTAAQAQSAVEHGYRTLKLKVGAESLERDAQRVRELRDAVGENVLLRLDANGCWRTESEAVAAIERLAHAGANALEQPVGPAELELLARVRAQSPIPIAADEAVRTATDLERVIALRAADAIVIKPMFCGGLLAARALGGRAAEAGLPVSVTTALESGIGRRGALHAAAAMPGELWSCGLCTGDLLAEDLAAGPTALGGELAPPEDELACA